MRQDVSDVAGFVRGESQMMAQIGVVRRKCGGATWRNETMWRRKSPGEGRPEKMMS